MILWQKEIKRIDLQANPQCWYVFGDNDARSGNGGQASEMRGEPNAVGIRVKKEPMAYAGSYYSDFEYEENTQKIKQDLDRIRGLLSDDEVVIIPYDGIGTGLAKLKEMAPRTFAFLVNQMVDIFDNDPYVCELPPWLKH